VNERELDRNAARRLAIIRHAREVTGNVAMTCRYYGISRQVFYTWLRRYETGGLAGLRDGPSGHAPAAAGRRNASSAPRPRHHRHGTTGGRQALMPTRSWWPAVGTRTGMAGWPGPSGPRSATRLRQHAPEVRRGGAAAHGRCLSAGGNHSPFGTKIYLSERAVVLSSGGRNPNAAFPVQRRLGARSPRPWLSPARRVSSTRELMPSIRKTWRR
jgi:transposase-like protein